MGNYSAPVLHCTSSTRREGYGSPRQELHRIDLK